MLVIKVYTCKLFACPISKSACSGSKVTPSKSFSTLELFSIAHDYGRGALGNPGARLSQISFSEEQQKLSLIEVH